MINLFSDSQTVATPAMLEAMTAAEVGDEQRGTDPTVLELETRVAGLLGHERAVFLPSGTMCNAIAVRLHIRPGGDEIVLHRDAHPADSEAGGAAALSGASIHRIDGPGGKFTGAELRAAIRAPDRYAPRSRLVVAEQTTGSGRIWREDELADIVTAARAAGMRAHLDGARLLNAVVASGVPAERFASDFDTVWIDFAKGLGCPLGAVLAGSPELIDEAWRYKQMWGGAMRQTGFVAAACLYALEHHVDRLAEDHGNARLLAEGLAALDGVVVDPASVETNIVIFSVAHARAVVTRAAELGTDLLVLDDNRLRAVTHYGVRRNDIPTAVSAIKTATAEAAG